MICNTFINPYLSTLKDLIDSIIKERASDSKKYWTSLLHYLEGELSQSELFEVVTECLGAENSTILTLSFYSF